MSGRDDLARLQKMSGLVFDKHATALHQAQAAKTKIQAQLAALDLAACDPAASLPEIRAGHDYQRWAAMRRAQLMTQLAARQAECAIAEERTRYAFGRNLMVSDLQLREANARKPKPWSDQ